MPIPKNSVVRQVVPAPIEGVVTDYAIDRESGITQVLVAWLDADGVPHERYLLESEVEVIQQA